MAPAGWLDALENGDAWGIENFFPGSKLGLLEPPSQYFRPEHGQEEKMGPVFVPRPTTNVPLAVRWPQQVGWMLLRTEIPGS